MDIIVTIPKVEYDNDDRETLDMQENDLVQFWTLGRTPKNINIGDRIYFLKNGEIESSMRIFDIQHNSSTKCETTERIWNGKCQLFLNDLRNEQFNYSNLRGFQGFRYFDNFIKSLNK